MATKITDKNPVGSFLDTDYLVGVFGGTLGKVTVDNLKKGLVENEDLYLQEIAFYIEINNAADAQSAHAPSLAASCNVGGNMHMLNLWLAEWKAALMDANGNAAELSDVNHGYTKDGVNIVDANNNLISSLTNCNFMGIIPETYCYNQTVSINGTTKIRTWASLMPIPGGWTEPSIPAGMFRGYVDGNGKLRSIPNVTPTCSLNINQFFNDAQALGKDFGLAGGSFRSLNLWRMMAEYACRSSQECKLEDGTLIWGPGLDGTESKSDGWNNQKDIKTGLTLSLGKADGKVATTDAAGTTVHVPKFLVFEGLHGQHWEFDGHLASLDSTNVKMWRSNFMPSAAPTASTFANIDTVDLLRNAASGGDAKVMNLISTEGEQCCVMIPQALNANGITYGDYFWWDAAGQVWLWGGDADDGSDCGLSCSHSGCGWPVAADNIGARLDYHGTVKWVTGQQLIKLQS